MPKPSRNRARAIAVAQPAPIVVSGRLWLLAAATVALAAAQLFIR